MPTDSTFLTMLTSAGTNALEHQNESHQGDLLKRRKEIKLLVEKPAFYFSLIRFETYRLFFPTKNILCESTFSSISIPEGCRLTIANRGTKFSIYILFNIQFC